jgi:hypothetical protein
MHFSFSTYPFLFPDLPWDYHFTAPQHAPANTPDAKSGYASNSFCSGMHGGGQFWDSPVPPL